MTGYVVRRLLLIIPTLLLLGTLLFFMLQFIPGDVASTLLAGEESAAPPEVIEKLRKELGLSDPLYVQYFRWLGKMVRGDLGYSPYFNQSVWDAIKPKIDVTVTLAILGVLVAIVVSIPAGVLSALFRGSWFDQAVRAVSAVGMAVPAFWLGIMILLVFSRVIGWAPPAQHYDLLDDPVASLQRFMFPALILGFRSAAVISRMIRSMMLEVLNEDYVRTAWSKGLLPRVVIVKHALRNALLPVVTMLGMLFASLLDGAVVLETVFNLPGIGLHLIESVRGRDATMVLGMVLVIGVFMMIWILLVDLSYKVLDPRVTYE